MTAFSAPWSNSCWCIAYRVREVMLLLGFPRFEAIGPDRNGELDLDMVRAVLAETISYCLRSTIAARVSLSPSGPTASIDGSTAPAYGYVPSGIDAE